MISSVGLAAKKAQPIFVLGSPRSGTTLIAAYISSSSGVLNLFEYGAFHWAFYWGDRLLFRHGGTEHRAAFLSQAAQLAAQFAEDLCVGRRMAAYVDSTPSNLLSAPQIVALLPEARFVVVLRHYTGVIASLKGSFERGRAWAGKNIQERAEIWRTFYGYALTLPEDRTSAISYDALCADPVHSLAELNHSLGGVLGNFTPRLESLCVNYAEGSPDRVIAVRRGEDVVLRRIESIDRTGWNSDDWQEAREATADIDALLRARFACYIG